MSKKLDMTNYARIAHFRYFTSLPNPFAGITVQIDVTDTVRYCKARGLSFYLAVMHAAALAADEIPQLRQRICDDGTGIMQYEECPTSHIELLEDETYCYCTLHHHMPLDAYFAEAERARAAARARNSLTEDGDADSMYFVSSLPWVHYTDITQAIGNDSNPRITWGKYEADYRGRLMMPITLLAHHALVDGVQFGKFFEGVEKKLKELYG